LRERPWRCDCGLNTRDPTYGVISTAYGKIPKQTEPGNLAAEAGNFSRENRNNRAIMSGIRELTGKSADFLSAAGG
jgi:hypothetical protein